MRLPFAFRLLPLLLLAGCAERRFAGPPPPESAAPPALAAGAGAPEGIELASAAVPSLPSGPAPSWVEAVRLERWTEAATLIDALPEATRTRPEMRYVRARAAVAIGGAGEGDRAVPLLEGLEAALPLLAADVARCRAEAQLQVGPFAPAAAYFARSRVPRDLTRAAEAYQKAGDLPAARALAERAVAAAHGKAADEAAARARRAEIARAQGQGPAPGDEGRAAAATGDGGAPAPAKPGKPVPRGEALHERAMELFRARSYEGAVPAFREAAAAGGGHEAEDLHYAARSLSRADKDREAIKVYHQVAARYPRSPFAERSVYFAARLDLLDGRFKEAAEAYTRYLATFRRGEHRDDAEYERALAWLSSGSPAPARAALATLAATALHKAPDRAARLRELEALAADRAGDHPAAVAGWTEIARSQPLTWAALMARARLAAATAPVPPLMDPEPAAPGRAALSLRLPPAPALLASLGLDGDAETHLLAEEREAAAPYAGRENEALCGLYGLLSRAKRRYRVGINAVDGASLLRAPSAAERWAWDCVYPRPFVAGVRALEEQLSLPRGLVHAVMRQESGFDPAIVSPASAVGLMQLLPATAKQAAGELALPFDDADLTRPDVNLRIGAFYIAKLLHMFHGDVALAAAAYNAGPRAVSHWVESSTDNELDLWVARIPFEETRTYVARVVQNLARYQWLEGGDGAVTELSLAIPADARAPADAY